MLETRDHGNTPTSRAEVSRDLEFLLCAYQQIPAVYSSVQELTNDDLFL